MLFRPWTDKIKATHNEKAFWRYTFNWQLMSNKSSYFATSQCPYWNHWFNIFGYRHSSLFLLISISSHLCTWYSQVLFVLFLVRNYAYHKSFKALYLPFQNVAFGLSIYIDQYLFFWKYLTCSLLGHSVLFCKVIF